MTMKTTTEDDRDEKIQHDQLLLIDDIEKVQVFAPLQNLDRQLILHDIDNDGNPRRNLSLDHKNTISHNGGNLLMKKRKLQTAGTSILGVGANNLLYTRDTLNSDWVLLSNNNSPPMVAVTAMKDGTLIGLGLYKCATFDRNWVLVPNSNIAMRGVTVMNDETILGIGINKRLYTHATLHSEWVQV